jgi:3'(2'), 5'-bisphosphate nucleotidase
VSGVTVQDHRDAVDIARAAGVLLLQLRAGIGAQFPADEGKALGDRRSHELIMRMLAERHPDDAVLSEESPSGKRGTGPRTWIVDPLDGTREFGEPPRTDWAVHVALALDDQLIAGAVALPAADRVLSTQDPPATPEAPGPRPRLVVSRTRPPAWVADVAAELDAELIPMGSAGAKIAAVITGDADLYLHDGGQYEWDSAAPIAVAQAARLHTSRLDGSPLRYNQPEPWLPDVAVCHRSIAERVLAVVAGLRSPS